MPPFLSNPIGDLEISTGERYKYIFPENVFTDYDLEILTYTATNEHGKELPGWIEFNPTERKFTFSPTQTGATTIKLIASDGKPGSAVEKFQILVSE